MKSLARNGVQRALQHTSAVEGGNNHRNLCHSPLYGQVAGRAKDFVLHILTPLLRCAMVEFNSTELEPVSVPIPEPVLNTERQPEPESEQVHFRRSRLTWGNQFNLEGLDP